MNRLYSILLIFVMATSVFAQTFRGLSVKDGLTDLVVNDIYKDSAGYVWMGTARSVERFDGVSFKHYFFGGNGSEENEVNAVDGMPGREIRVGNNTGLWQVSDAGLVRLFPNRIKTKVFALAHDDERWFVATKFGLWITCGDSAKQVLVHDDILSPENYIKDVMSDGNGHVWMVSSNQLCRLNLSDGLMEKFSPGALQTSDFTRVYVTRDTVYLGTSRCGVWAFISKTNRFEPVANVGHVTSLSGDGAGCLHVGTNGGGIYFISASGHRILRNIRHNPDSPDGLRSNSVYSLLVDREGIIWVGLFQIGVDYSLYQYPLFTPYHAPSVSVNLEHYAVRTLEFVGDEKLIGTRDGLFYINERENRCLDLTPQMRSPMVYCSYVHDGKYYIGTHSGMYEFNPTEGKLRDFFPQEENPFVSGQVYSITSDPEGRLWVGTSCGVFAFEDGRCVHHFHSGNSRLPNNSVHFIFFDSTRRGWLCTNVGMALIQSDEECTVTDGFPKDFAANRFIQYMMEDSEHQLYFLPDKGNLLVSDLRLSQVRVIEHTPFAGKKLQCMIEDAERRLWIGTDNGLYRWDKRENTASYNFMDGVPSSIFLNCHPRQTSDGRLWFGCARGLFYTDPQRIKTARPYPYPLAFTALRTRGEELPLFYDAKEQMYEAVLSAPDELTLDFSNFSYTDPRYMCYEYKMDGEDAHWTFLEGRSTVTFYRLPAGNHTFLLRRPGQENSEISMRIKVPASHPMLWLWCTLTFVFALSVGALSNLWWKRRKSGVPVSVENDGLAQEVSSEEKSHGEGKYRSVNIPVEECRILSERLTALMGKEKPYIHPDLKLSDLAGMLGVPSYKLSYLFSQYLNRSYYDYVNDYRVEEFKQLVDKGEHKSYTINTLMERCGFLSRTSFFRYFRKQTGQTPNEYIKARA